MRKIIKVLRSPNHYFCTNHWNNKSLHFWQVRYTCSSETIINIQWSTFRLWRNSQYWCQIFQPFYWKIALRERNKKNGKCVGLRSWYWPSIEISFKPLFWADRLIITMLALYLSCERPFSRHECKKILLPFSSIIQFLAAIWLYLDAMGPNSS